ncbi:MAG: serine/threonine-protein kinase, partial [Planctomycetota bacterium]
MNLGGYEILGPIGSGGAGTVFRARAPSGEFVAIKVLHRSDVTASARLKRELDVQRSLGDGFVPLLASGAAPQGAFIVMPLIEGGTLRERLKRGPLPLAEAIRLGVELGDALGRAHGSGIIHRDLKPENVLYHSGRPLIADLGLAKLVDSNDSLSRTGDTRGTFGYMPPEQMRDAKRAGPAADVFSLGVVIFECLAGESPFRGETPLLLVDAVEEGRFVPLRKLRPDVPRAVASVIERALAADEDDRFEDGEEFAEALRRAWRKGARPRATLIVVATALAVAGGFGAAILSRPRPLSAPNPAAPPAPPKPPSPTTTTTTP